MPPGRCRPSRPSAEGGYVAEEDAATFARAYRILRTVEHRLQLANERRTHTIPEDGERQERLARSMGYRAEGDVAAREPFLAELRAVQAQVRDLHAKLFYRPLLETHAAVPVGDADLVRSRGMADDAARERLWALGFVDAAAALRDLRALTAGVTRAARTVQAVLPAYLHELASTPDPDTGMRRFRDLIEAQSSNQTLLAGCATTRRRSRGSRAHSAPARWPATCCSPSRRGVEWFDEHIGEASPPGRAGAGRAGRRTPAVAGPVPGAAPVQAPHAAADGAARRPGGRPGAARSPRS